MYGNSIAYKQIMKKWKYYYLNDSNQETIGIVLAEGVDEAYIMASEIKKLPLVEFKNIFKIEKL